MIIQKKIYVCDLCKHEEEEWPNLENENDYGRLTFKGAKITYKRDLLLCFNCCENVHNALSILEEDKKQ